MKPVCPDDNYELTKDCKCIKKQIKTLNKLPKCKPGKVRNPKTKRCIKKVVSKQKTITKPKNMTKKAITKRCPNGTKKNKKTGLCESSNPSITRIEKSIKIPSATPRLQQTIGNKIMKELLTPMKKTPQNINKLVRSFSPLVNEQLITRQTGLPKTSNLFCGRDYSYAALNGISLKNIDIPKIMVGGKCHSVFSEKAKKHLRGLLSYSRNNLKMEDVTAPKQVDSNCWFNTMFMAFFISNKGRKFFKFFRQLMIDGTTSQGKILKPGMKKTLAYLNLAIEASMTPNINILDSFDTNAIIHNIYKNIPAHFKKNKSLHGPHIKQVGDAGNPIAYYTGLTNFLDTKGVNFLRLNYHWLDKILGKNVYDPKTKSIEYTVKNSIDYYQHKNNIAMPEVIILEVSDQISEVYPNNNTTIEHNNVKYVLDSAIVRDTKQAHFCALLKIGNDECGFDGASYRKLSKFEWSKNMGKDVKWTFEGSNWDGNGGSIEWNFRKCHSILIYYRV